MDYTILVQIIGVLILVLGGTYLFFKAKERKWLKESDLTNINLCFDLTYSVAKQIGLTKQPYAKELLEIVNETLKYFENIEHGTVEDIQNKALVLVLELCERKNIEINDDKKEMLKILINIGVKEIVLK